nr:maltose ABC transporter substrate-binding protein [Paenibacillus plantiphilus]
MKRKGLLILLAALLTFTLAACGGANEDKGNKNAENKPANTNTNKPNGNASTPPPAEELLPEEGASLLVWEESTDFEFLESVAADFKTKYNVDVKFEHVPSPDQADRLANDAPAGLAADVVMFAHDKLGNAVEAGLLFPNDLLEEDTKSAHPDAAIQASSYGGTLYGYPKSVETYAVFYNKALVKDLPKTWDDVVAFSKTFTDNNAKKYGIMWEARLLYFNYPFFVNKGGYIWGKDNTDPTDIGLNNEGAIEGAKYMQTMAEILPLKAENITWDVKTQLFSEGKVAFNIDGPWSISSFKDKVDFGVIPLPDMPDGSKSISLSGVRSYYVNSYTKYPNAAKLFASFVTNKENALKAYNMLGILPSNKEAAADPAITNDPILSGFIKQFENSVPMPSIPETNNVWTPIEGAITKIWNNKDQDVKAALDEAVNTIKESLASGK